MGAEANANEPPQHQGVFAAEGEKKKKAGGGGFGPGRQVKPWKNFLQWGRRGKSFPRGGPMGFFQHNRL